MPPSGNGVIGNAVIEVTVDPSKIKAGFAQAGQVAAKETPKIAKQVDAQGGLLGTATGIKQFSKPLREFREAIQGSATAVFGMAGTVSLIAAGVTGVVYGLREAWKYATSVSTVADRMGHSVSEVANQADRLKARLQAISEQNRPGILDKSDLAQKLLDDQKFDEYRKRQIEEYQRQADQLESRLKTLPELIQNATRSMYDFSLPGNVRTGIADDLDRMRKEFEDAPRQIQKLRQLMIRPEANEQRQAFFGRISQAEAEDIASEATKINQKVARSRMSALDRLNAEEADAISVVSDKAATATEDKLAAYQKLEAAMRNFYKAERDEIQRNASEAIKAQQNVLKQASMDNTWRMVTGIEDLGQKLDVLIMQQRSMER